VPDAGWFGAGDEALFGFVHAPQGDRHRDTAVVIVPPLGYEAICAHAVVRRIAERLADQGFFVLRYDHPGSGDSAGEGSGLRGLLDGLSRAVTEVRARSGAERVALIGLRYGALLALETARARADVAALVAWAPPPSGRAYVRELRALGNFSDVSRERSPEHEEIAGFAYSAETLADLAGVDPRTLSCPPETSVLIVPRDDVPIPPAERLGPWASRAEVRALPGYAAALRDPHEVQVSEPLLDGIASWLAERFPVLAKVPQSLAPSAALDLGSAIEEVVTFGPGERLFGVVTRPRRAAASDPCVLFLNPGAIHRIGMNRNYVALARDWAQRGVTCLRFDAAGLGDSQSHRPGTGGVLYSRETVGDVKSAIDFMAERYGARRFVLAGLCAGAYTAFHTALADARVDTAFVINPQTFDFKPGDSLSVQRRRAYRDANWYRRSALKAESWRKALRGEVDLVRVGRVLAARLAVYAERRLNGTDSLARAFGEICRRGTRVLLVYSADDPGLDHLRDELGGALDRLKQDPHFALEVIDGADHTFTPLASQESLAGCLERYLMRWHAAAAA
jgi:alpha/beta superfamily hydrolase